MDIDKLKDPKEIENLANRLGAAHIGHELVLSDNMTESLTIATEDTKALRHPVKMLGASFMLCTAGSITYHINFASHTVKAGEVLIMLPGAIVQIVDVDDNFRCATIAFASHYYEEIVNVEPMMRLDPVVTLPPDDMDECIDIYGRLSHRISRSDDDVARRMAKGYMMVMGAIIFERWKGNLRRGTPHAASRPKELFIRFLAEVQVHYRLHRSVNYYADVLCVSPKYLSMVVKSEGGRNASDYIDELVILDSKALLMDGRYSVQQVADMLQFPNPGFFSRYFKRHCGESPSEYRKHR